MNQSINFSDGLNQYILMALKIWPALQLSLPNLHQASSPPPQSPILPRNYQAMTSQQFITTMSKDMVNYILQHDVKPQHIIDYLDDILFVLNTEQQNNATVTYMANQLCALINQLAQGNAERLINFRFTYNGLKGQNLHHHIQANQQQGQQQQQDDEDYDDQMDQQDNQQMEQEQHNTNTNNNNTNNNNTNNNNNGQSINKLSEGEKKDLQDDGWVVVTKKSKK